MVDQGECLIVIATYNERETLPPLLEAIFATVPTVDVLVVDDNSPDGTGAWCEEYSRQDPRLRCLHRPSKQGLGSAIIAGLREGIAQGYRYVLTMDADFSHPPHRLPDLLAAMEPADGPKVDVAIGSRYIPGGRIEGWPLRRHLMSRAINWFARLMLGLPVRDCSGNFRCYRAATLAQLDFNEFCSSGYAFFEEILYRLRKIGAVFCEVPITFVDRRKGASKITWQEGLHAVSVIMKLALNESCRRKKRREKPGLASSKSSATR
ncbi:polyprenol monophosphomannose synthase [Thermogutta sp.]|jgi:dolichol-phosphate mannosyltransferase|uniref:polyprenol monophosphomannose synthase n=1 Tax=Thermogutta sp. TaxID=1962930 RepID=UPI00321FE81C